MLSAVARWVYGQNAVYTQVFRTSEISEKSENIIARAELEEFLKNFYAKPLLKRYIGTQTENTTQFVR